MIRATRWKTIRIALVLVATVALAPGGEARGDACSECGPPTLTELGEHTNFQLDTRYGSKDYVETDGGECTFEIQGEPTMKKTDSWLILRGEGEVWNCPFGSSEDTMTAAVSESDSSGWTLSASAKVSLKSLGTGVESTVTAAVNQSCTIQEVTSISKKLKAAYCHRIPWQAFFEVATYEAQVNYTLSRRFAWWTKNVRTGHIVHRHGEVWIVCEAGTATLDAEAPISGQFHLSKGPCPDEECKAQVTQEDLGFWPTPFPPAEEEDSEEEEAEDEDADPPFTSADLPDPPAGIPPPPEGFEDYYETEPAGEDEPTAADESEPEPAPDPMTEPTPEPTAEDAPSGEGENVPSGEGETEPETEQ